MYFKPAFVEKYSNLTDWAPYKACVEQFRRKALRANTLKISVPKLREHLTMQGWHLEQVPWCEEGFYLVGERRDIGQTAEHKAGLVFVQRSTSMIPSIVLNPKPKDTVLDMCAAPGGKTTHLAAIMQSKGVIVANEFFKKRVKELQYNLQRCGAKNTVVMQQDGASIRGMTFDKVLVDAPCSNSGSLKGKTKKSAEIMRLWNARRVRSFAKLQKKLLMHAYDLLKGKGVVVYSTCSLDPEEDEEVVDYVLAQRDAKLEKITLPVKAADKKYCKIWPQYQDTDGFFVAKLRKP